MPLQEAVQYLNSRIGNKAPPDETRFEFEYGGGTAINDIPAQVLCSHHPHSAAVGRSKCLRD